MPRKPAHFIFYLSTLQKPAAGAGFCNVLKYKDDTFYLSTIQKPAPGLRCDGREIRVSAEQWIPTKQQKSDAMRVSGARGRC